MVPRTFTATLRTMIVTHTGATPGKQIWAQLLAPNPDGTTATIETKDTIVKTDGTWSIGLHAPADLPTVETGSFWSISEPTATGNVRWQVYVAGTPGTTADISTLTAVVFDPSTSPNQTWDS